mgnify:CR=1 FL=1
MLLGAGRENKDATIDLGVGVEVVKKVGDKVAKGEIIAYIHANHEEKLVAAKERFLKAYSYSETQPVKTKIIKHIL